MKKSCFKILCMVLIIALLAPNAFAATPAPEAPLADAATVERVKQEIAAGEITDMEDLFLVAYQHLGADLEEDGMTAYINKDGTLGLTQIINLSKTKDGRLVKDEYAITTVLLVDIDGNQITNYASLLSNAPDHDTGGLDDVMVYASHTAYYLERTVGLGDYKYEFQSRLSHMTTTLSYGTNLYRASRLEQSFNAKQDQSDVMDEGNQTTYNPAAGPVDYIPSGTKWYKRGPDAVGGGINTFATVYITNSNLSFTLETTEDFYVDPTLPREGMKQ